MNYIERNTKETQIRLKLLFPGNQRHIDIPCGFLSHMLDIMLHRCGAALELKAQGDVHIDAHHLTEDIGIVLGQAVLETAKSEPRARYGECLMPMDGSLAQIALDLSGRGGFFPSGLFPSGTCGDYDMELVPEFFHAFCREARITLHAALLAADNSHHAAEALFKGVGLALGRALQSSSIEPSSKEVWL